MTEYAFDQSNITWRQLEGIEHLDYFILDLDRERQVADLLLRFAANEKIMLHRHVALNHLFVVQGEHIIYEPDGTIKEVRPTGRYTVSQASDEPHREGGGEQEVIVLFSIRGTDGLMYEFLDDDFNVVGTFGMDDIENLMTPQ